MATWNNYAVYVADNPIIELPSDEVLDTDKACRRRGKIRRRLHQATQNEDT
jgi:hypothetical protein